MGLYGFVGYLWFSQKIQLSGFILVFIVFLLLLTTYLHWRQLERILTQVKAIYWNQQQWSLLINKRKRPIVLSTASRILPNLILLKYHFRHTAERKIMGEYSLVLARDAMSDEDFRHLSRTLKFLGALDKD